MANSYSNDNAYLAYRKALQEALDAKALRKELLKEGEKAAERARHETVGTFEEKIAAIRAAWVPFHEEIAKLDAEIEKNYATADEQFDVWKGLK